MVEFNFQSNEAVDWKYNDLLLAKAEENKPQLQTAVIKLARVERLVRDDTKFHGWQIVDDETVTDSLSSYAMGRDDSIIFDFGNHYVGHFQVDIQHVGSPMDAPVYLHFKFAEMPAELTGNLGEYEGWLPKSWIAEEFIHLDEIPTQLSLPRRYAFRYVQIKVIDTSAKFKITFNNPEITAVSAVLNEKVKIPLGVNDKLLQKIDAVGIKTLQDSMQDVYEDGPKRDHRLWLGDLRLQALANYATFDDRQLVKRSLYLFAGMTTVDGQIPANVFTAPQTVADDTFLFDYSLFFISVLHDYYLHTHDEKVLNDLFETAQTTIDLALTYVNESSILMLSDEYPVFIDWQPGLDKAAAAQAVMIYVLRQFITLLEVKHVDSSVYQKELDALILSANTNYFDQSEGLFVSGSNRQINLASQIWMVLAGVLSDEKNYKLMARTQERLFPIRDAKTPYAYHHIVEALFVSGHNESAVNLIKEYWGGMIALGADTFWEAFNPENPDFSPYGNILVNSYSHAWSATPPYLLRKYVEKVEF